MINNIHSTYAQKSDSTSIVTAPKSSIEHPVDYNSEDSTIIDFKEEVIYLYGNAYVKYDDIDIKADYIEFRFGEDLVVAKYVLDSIGKKVGRPIFTEGGESYTMDEIQFNTKTKKGVIFNVITEQNDGYLHAEKIKKQDNDNIHLRKGKYTTCDKENPHYHFRLSKAVVIPEDKIVSGPMNLYLGKIPTPLGLPFAFFPNKKNGTNGLIVPEFGSTQTYGFSLTNGGYYFKPNEYVDFSFLGSIYSKGSWGLGVLSQYNKRYKFSGNVDISFNKLKEGIKETSSFSQENSFFVRWNHNQDGKSRPGTRFSATVNAGTSNYNKTGLDFNSNDYLKNRFQSNISYGKSWKGKPYNLSLNLRHEQNRIDDSSSLINATLPEISFNLSRVDPLDIFRKNKIGTKKIKLGFTYSATTKNDLTVVDSLIDINNLSAIQSKFRNGVRHTAALNAPIKLFKVFTFNTGISFTDRMYLQTIDKSWNSETASHETDTIKGFANNFDYSLNSSLTTTFYGMYGFAGPLKGKREAKIRHVMSPSVAFTYRPDFGTEKIYTDDSGNEFSYSPFDIGIFGKSNSGESGILSFSISNSLEMKLKNFKDSSDNAKEYRKVKLIENFTVRSGYDIMKDSFNLSNYQLSARTTLFKIFTVNAGASIDPYSYNNGLRINTFQFGENGRIGTLRNGNAALGIRLRSKTKKEAKVFNPWDAVFSYNYFYNRQISETIDTAIVTNTISLDGGINITKLWRFDTKVHYDHQQGKVAFVEFNLYRDMHCWEANFNIIPFGSNNIRRYTFRINIKASALKDLKWEKRNNNFNSSIL